MKFEISKHTIWISSNGSKKDNEKVVMAHRLLLEENASYDDGGMLEESAKKGISLTVCSFDTIEDLKQECNWIKTIIRDKGLTPTETDILETRKYEDQLNLN